MPATEQTLLQRAQQGDQSAFAQLYQQGVGRVYAIAWRLLANRARAEEAVQETFLRVWQQLPGFGARVPLVVGYTAWPSEPVSISGARIKA